MRELTNGKRGLFPRYVGASRSDCTHGQFRTTLIDFTIERGGRETPTTGILKAPINSNRQGFRITQIKAAVPGRFVIQPAL